jgi:hypothetical protein
MLHFDLVKTTDALNILSEASSKKLDGPPPSGHVELPNQFVNTGCSPPGMLKNIWSHAHMSDSHFLKVSFFLLSQAKIRPISCCTN